MIRDPNVFNLAIRSKVEPVTKGSELWLKGLRFVCISATSFTPEGTFSVSAHGKCQASAKKLAQGKLLASVAAAITAQGERQDQ